MERAEGDTIKEEEDEDEIPSTPIPSEWVCLGSDIEIKEGMFKNSRPLVSEPLVITGGPERLLYTLNRELFKFICV